MSVTEKDIAPALDGLGEEQLRRLVRASNEFNSSLELPTLLPRVLDHTMETLAAEGGSLWLMDNERLRCALARGQGAERLSDAELPIGTGLLGEAIARRKPSLISENSQDAERLQEVSDSIGVPVRSVVTVPLLVQGGAVGVIQTVNQHSEDGTFDEIDLHFVEALADDAAAAIRNARLFESERRAHDLRALLDFSHEITSSLDAQRVALSIVNLAGRAVQFDRCALALWYDEKLTVRAISGEATVDRKAPGLKELERFLTWAAERRAVLQVNDLQDADDELAQQIRSRFAAYIADARVRGILLLPIQDGEGQLGVVLYEYTSPPDLKKWDLEAAQLVSSEAALALRNAELYANVPFIQWLEPLRERKRALVALPGPVWLAYLGILAVIIIITGVVRMPLRVPAREAVVRASVERPLRSHISGIIDAVMVREGATVAAGAPVARVRNEDLLARLREAEAGVAMAEREALAAQGSGNPAAAVLARVRGAQYADTRALLAAEVARGRVTAPISGTVLTPRMEEKVGGFVDAGEPIAWIGNPDWVELEMKVSQEDVGEIRPSDRVRARVNALPSVTFEGRVVAVAPRADSSAAPLYTVRAVLDNRAHMLKPGMAIRARVLARSRPLAALAFRRPLRWLRMHMWW